MKTYKNGMKSTEFTKKQIGVVYYKAKAGELKVEKWIMSDLYDMADYYNYDYNGNAAACEQKILSILDSVFEGNLEEAQKKINAYTEQEYSLLGLKAQKSVNREMVG